MALTADSPTTAAVDLGGEWVLSACAYDADGQAQPGSVVTASVTDPAGVITAPAVSSPTSAVFRAVLYPVVAGRWTGHLDSDVGRVYFAVQVSAPAALPTVDDLLGPTDSDDGYLGPTSWSVADVTEALREETAAQASVCRIPAAYPDDLRGALMRRVACNLARRALALGMTQGDAETGTAAYLPGTDPEVRRLEGPWRKLTVG